MIAYFIQGFALGFPNAAVPGPFQAYLLSQTLKNGWKRSLPIALAPLISDGPIIVLVLLVLSRIPKQALALIQIAGGFFILYLAYGAFKAFRTAAADQPAVPDKNTGRQGIIKGALLNMLNPAPYLFWSMVGGPLLVKGWHAAPDNSVAFLVGFYGTLITGFAALILLFGTVGRINAKLNRVLTGISTIALLLFGIWQLYYGISRLFV
ncbi:MAG: LysE family translocator [Candidatus Aminicenantes bacterium]|nr:LysE family translocator [Candidatus Aminicenantes bacterium]